MAQLMILQGREIGEHDITLIRDLLDAQPEWCRSRLGVELCTRWDWRNAMGQPKDMAARTLLLKLERAGYIRLPARRRPSPNEHRNRRVEPPVPPQEPLCGALGELQPLGVSIVAPGSPDARLFQALLAHEHYRGRRNTVGENLRCLVRDRSTREANLQRLTSNTRFLISGWVQVPHLTSHVLGLIVRRIAEDWQAKYGHPVYPLMADFRRELCE